MSIGYENLEAYIKGLITGAITSAPTGKSLQDILHKDGNFTFDNTTDSLEALSDAISGLSLLSDKEESLLGIGVFPGFQDYFNTVVNDGAPDTTFWNVLDTGMGAVEVINDTGGAPAGYLSCTGQTDGDDAIADTRDKVVFSIKDTVTTLHFKTHAELTFGDDTIAGIGFVGNERTLGMVIDFYLANSEVATIVVKATDHKPYACTSDGTTLESTDLSAYITSGTWYDFEIIITASDVKFYIDGTLRATHSTNVPSSVWQLAIGAQCIDTGDSHAYVEYVQVWGE